MYHFDNVILSDVDGVMLYWLHSFEFWMNKHGYTKKHNHFYEIDYCYDISSEKAREMTTRFNESAAIGWLPPYLDALKYVRKFHEEHGMVFHCITAINSDFYVKKLRKQNLERVFGKTAIERLECVDSSKDKVKYLKEYEGSELPWIEDVYENAMMGVDLGLKVFLFDQPYNKQKEYNKSITVVSSWKEIYDEMV